ncbi:MAG: hypothetical protein KDC80_17865, partial [Saprospiraceae bacterium]|nr:hypothetical protein [Saprospiraceae bacterium]
MRIYFLVPDHEIPSWGIGMIYHLAISSIDLGLDAQILRMSESTSVPAWLNAIVQQSTLPAIKNQISNSDILIIPEILVADLKVQLLRARKVVLIQGSVMIPIGLKSYADYQALGYVHAIAIMPHIRKVLQNFWPIHTTIISPFIAEYFFITQEREEIRARKKQILLYPKPGYREA